MSEIAYINGVFLPIDEAAVPIDDRGYQFGDGVYEVIRSYDGRLWAFDRHMERLQRSLSLLEIPADSAMIRERAEEAFLISSLDPALIYIQVTRGIQARNHVYTDGLDPGLLITVRRLEEIPPEEYRQGIRVITRPDERWARRDIKSLNLLANCLAMKEAARENAFEPVLHENGIITEAASASLFIVSQGALITREPGHHILPGITRAQVIDLAMENGIPVQERPFPVNDLFTADEAFLTSSTFGLLGISHADNRPIGTGEPGPVTRGLHELYRALIRRTD